MSAYPEAGWRVGVGRFGAPERYRRSSGHDCGDAEEFPFAFRLHGLRLCVRRCSQAWWAAAWVDRGRSGTTRLPGGAGRSPVSRTNPYSPLTDSSCQDHGFTGASSVSNGAQCRIRTEPRIWRSSSVCWASCGSGRECPRTGRWPNGRWICGVCQGACAGQGRRLGRSVWSAAYRPSDVHGAQG